MLKLIFLSSGKNRSIARKLFNLNSINEAKYGLSIHDHKLKVLKSTIQLQKETTSNKLFNQYGEDTTTHSVTTDKNMKIIFESINDLSDIKDSVILEKYISDLDIKIISMMDSLNCSEIFELLHVLNKTIPNKLVSTFFYGKSISLLIKTSVQEKINKQQMTQLLYFISLKNDGRKNFVNYLQPHLPDMEELTESEKHTVAESHNRILDKLSSKQHEIFKNVFETNLKQSASDSNLYVSLTNTMVNEKNHQLNSMKISKIILELERKCSFPVIVNFLAFYGKALILEPKVVDKLFKDAMEIIKLDIRDSQPKLSLQSFDKLLWSISKLGLTLTFDEKVTLRTYMEKRFQEYKKIRNLTTLVNSMLCLHILKCWSTKIMETCLRDCLFLPVYNKTCHWKLKTRLDLLISQMTLEIGIKVPKFMKQQLEIGFTPSIHLQIIKQVALQLTDMRIIKAVEIECPIRSLVIPGVTLVTQRGTYHIDVLDNSTCLKNTNIPHGWMKLKLSLLPKLKYGTILINGDIFNNNLIEANTLIQQQILKAVK